MMKTKNLGMTIGSILIILLLSENDGGIGGISIESHEDNTLFMAMPCDGTEPRSICS